LNYCQPGNSQSKSGELPSWIPDWTIFISNPINISQGDQYSAAVDSVMDVDEVAKAVATEYLVLYGLRIDVVDRNGSQIRNRSTVGKEE